MNNREIVANEREILELNPVPAKEDPYETIRETLEMDALRLTRRIAELPGTKILTWGESPLQVLATIYRDGSFRRTGIDRDSLVKQILAALINGHKRTLWIKTAEGDARRILISNRGYSFEELPPWHSFTCSNAKTNDQNHVSGNIDLLLKELRLWPGIKTIFQYDGTYWMPIFQIDDACKYLDRSITSNGLSILVDSLERSLYSEFLITSSIAAIDCPEETSVQVKAYLGRGGWYFDDDLADQISEFCNEHTNTSVGQELTANGVSP